MRVLLMNRDTDFDPEREAAWNEPDLIQDLELETLLAGMAGDDPFLLNVSRRALLDGLRDPQAITYRQEVLRDFLAHPILLADLWNFSSQVRLGKRHFSLNQLFRSPENTLFRSMMDLQEYVAQLRQLRVIAEENMKYIHSEALTRFFDMLVTELDDDYLAKVAGYLHQIDTHVDVHMSASLGLRLNSEQFILHYPPLETRRWWEYLNFKKPKYVARTIKYEDLRGRREMDDLRTQGFSLVVDVVAASSEHVRDFLEILRAELGFYVACLNLHERLVANGYPTCFPAPGRTGQNLVCKEVYDPCLVLTTNEPVVGNSVDALDAPLIVITGANKGGKSTFLRSLGVSQVMFQAGMFAPARSLRMNPAGGLFTHFRREEDPTMTSGKLDEDLARMSEIVDHLTPDSLILCNESFAATNEIEGSYLSREIIQALVESGMRVAFVTHMYELARGLRADRVPGVVFLRAPRSKDGTRPFRLVAGEPLPTSYGKDVFDRVFGSALSET